MGDLVERLRAPIVLRGDVFYGPPAIQLEAAALIKQQRAVMRELVEALKYARRFLREVDHDVAYVDAALARAKEMVG